jgi:hypothetical protein
MTTSPRFRLIKATINRPVKVRNYVPVISGESDVSDHNLGIETEEERFSCALTAT